MSNFFEMGSRHIQPAWESNNNNKKKVEERGGKGTAAPVSLRRSLQSGERGGRAGAGGAGPGGGSGRSSLRGWDVPDASFAAERRSGLGSGGEGGPREGAGCAACGGSSATCVALGLPQTAVLALGACSSAPPGFAFTF